MEDYTRRTWVKVGTCMSLDSSATLLNCNFARLDSIDPKKPVSMPNISASKLFKLPVDYPNAGLSLVTLGLELTKPKKE